MLTYRSCCWSLKVFHMKEKAYRAPTFYRCMICLVGAGNRKCAICYFSVEPYGEESDPCSVFMQRSDLSYFSPSEKRQRQANAPSCWNMHADEPTPHKRTWYILERGISSAWKKCSFPEKKKVNFILHRWHCFHFDIFCDIWSLVQRKVELESRGGNGNQKEKGSWWKREEKKI